MTDPTGARMRMINSFWDSPRYPIIELPALPLVPAAVAPVATATAAPAPAAVVTAPKLTLSLPIAKARKVKTFVAEGLAFKIVTDKPATDVELRLFEVLSTGLRPLGVAFRNEPGPEGAHLTLVATNFAKVKLKGRGKRKLRAMATATGRDGTIGRAQADFTIS